MKKTFLFVCFSVIAMGTLRAEHTFRVDLRNIKGSEVKTALVAGEDIRVQVAGNQKDGLLVEGVEDLERDSNIAVSFTFTSEKDGAFDLWLRGPWRQRAGKGKIDKLWVIYEQLKVTGAEVRNCNFTFASPEDAKIWRQVGKGAVRTEGKAKVWHDGSLAQTIQVKAGIPVTITFVVRDGGEELEP